MATLGETLTAASEQLCTASESARLDAELLLAHVLQVNRSYLFAWPEQSLEHSSASRFHGLLNQRLKGVPIAYLLGAQEFWSLSFFVGPGVLIPRADTETLVEAALEFGPAGKAVIFDLGTGSGAVACALAHERPQWSISAVDCSKQALEFANRNAKALALANVTCIESNWFDALPENAADVIVSNPPYIETADQHLHQGDLRYEPLDALQSGADGFDAIRSIVAQAPHYLKSEGWLMLEHGYSQADTVAYLLQQAGFVGIAHREDLAGHRRVTMAQYGASKQELEKDDEH